MYVVILLDSIMDEYMELFGIFNTWEECMGKIFDRVITEGKAKSDRRMPGEPDPPYKVKYNVYDDYDDIDVDYDEGNGFVIYRIFKEDT